MIQGRICGRSARRASCRVGHTELGVARQTGGAVRSRAPRLFELDLRAANGEFSCKPHFFSKFQIAVGVVAAERVEDLDALLRG